MALRRWSLLFALSGTCAALSSTEAQANGNVSHQWVSKTAAELVPAEGSLRALVGDPALRQALYTGTMFPDWGYTPGATADEGRQANRRTGSRCRRPIAGGSPTTSRRRGRTRRGCTWRSTSA
ncbi:hypothetical protein [Nannocystis pusilla]|uniref:hypothetical protein n=1 Tax=Nannocystis pusilla TaxID=889268 RepID=UPI003B7D05B8